MAGGVRGKLVRRTCLAERGSQVPVKKETKSQDPANEIAPKDISLLIPGILFAVNCVLAFLVLSVESTYLPWDEYLDGSTVTDLCFVLLILIPVILVVSAERYSILERGRAVRGFTYSTWFISVIGIFLSPPIYLVHLSRQHFEHYPVASSIQPTSEPRPSKGAPLFVLLSDTHVTERKRTLENFPADKKRLVEILAHVASVAPRYCIVSGDLTDRGTQEEWQVWDSAVVQAIGSNQNTLFRFLLAPGNHDLQGAPQEGEREPNYVDTYKFDLLFLNRARLFYDEEIQRGRFLKLASRHQLGESSFLTRWIRLSEEQKQTHILTTMAQLPSSSPGATGDSGTQHIEIPMTVIDYPAGFNNTLTAATQAFEGLFPLIHEDPVIGAAFVILDSSVRVHPGGSMGLGDLGDAQLDRLGEYLSSMKADSKFKFLIVALHHAPVRRETDAWLWREALRKRTNSDIWNHTFLALNVHDAAILVRLLDDFAESHKDVNVVIAHGHRHAKFLGKTQHGVWVIEAPAVVENENGFWAGYDVGGRFAVEWVNGSKTIQGTEK
jgi:3',5'-cyclic AMP phosphodiesterase CpdA